jgi:hypothetical protein
VFESAKTVVIARLTTSTRTSASGHLREFGIVENAWFVVDEVLKGSHVVGETIHTRTEFTPGPCGINVRNDPPWLWTGGDSRSADDLVPFVISDSWLIFGWGEQPYDISRGYSSPMNVRGATLRKLLGEIRDADRENGN